MRRITINNLPSYAEDYFYIVARWIRTDNGIEHWFYGAWNNRNVANEVALELGNGVVFKSEDFFKKPKVAETYEPTIEERWKLTYDQLEREHRQAWNQSMSRYEFEQHMMFLQHMMA